MQELPIDSYLPQILEALRDSPNLVLVAPPGAGKTTRVPPAVLAAKLVLPEHPVILMLQPRRVAARASAERIAEENGWQLGREVGYHIRFEKRYGASTRLRVLTEGILTRQLLADPFLEGVGMVILDEFHERNLHTDLAVALLREIQQTVRPDLKLVVMSATLQAEPVAAFLNAPIVRTEGRVFPVEVSHHPVGDQRMENQVLRLVEESVERDLGDVLVFLPGVGEIERARAALLPLESRDRLVILPLHGSLTSEEQHRALARAAAGVRKIILATNIAETSLTIDGVRTVIDSGLARINSFDADRGMDRLDLQRISKASATQRAGRAGRTAPGRCLRMWSVGEDKNLAEFEIPEIMRVDLAPTTLALHAWGSKDARAFGWFERPPESMLAAAEDLLELLGATHDGVITETGRAMLTLPTHPRLARLLIEAAHFGLLREGATIAALLSEKDIVRRSGDFQTRGPRMKADSDITIRLEALQSNAVNVGELDSYVIKQVLRVRDELLRIAERLPAQRSGDTRAVLLLPLFAFPDRVVRRRESDPTRGVMVGGSGIKLAPESGVLEPELFLALALRHDDRSSTREAQVTLASGIEQAWLEKYFPQAISTVVVAHYDSERQRVVGMLRERYRDLLLREDPNANMDAAVAGRALAAALVPQAETLFRADEAAVKLLDRVSLLRQHMPEHPWPKFDAEQLALILSEACANKRSLAEVLAATGGLAQLLHNQLQYPLNRLLDQYAPETYEVPTGNKIRIDYAENQSPILAVRLQELFGLLETPRIANGRVPLTLHLLAPNYRPTQITSDLRSFWKTAYFEVRKDLRARYPKHSWPEDPLTAPPQARGRSRR